MRFAAIGDWGEDTKERKECIELLKKESLDFAILLGDNLYPDGIETPMDEKWQDNFENTFKKTDFPIKFYSILGNHDHHLNPDAQSEFSLINSRWVMPSHTFKMKKRNVGFYFLDTERIINEEQDLDVIDSMLRRSKEEIRIVCGHHPIFSSGDHGDNKFLIKNLLPILEKNKVNIYLAGHDHHLEILKSNNLMHFISGAFATPRGIKKGHKKSLKSIPEKRGFMIFEIEGGKIDVRLIS